METIIGIALILGAGYLFYVRFVKKEAKVEAPAPVEAPAAESPVKKARKPRAKKVKDVAN